MNWKGIILQAWVALLLIWTLYLLVIVFDAVARGLPWNFVLAGLELLAVPWALMLLAYWMRRAVMILR